MNRLKINNIDISQALFLSFFVILIPLFISCTKSNLTNNRNTPYETVPSPKEINVKIKIAEPISFDWEQKTKSIGKERWEIGDRILVKVELFESTQIEATPKTEKGLTYEFNGSAWVCVYGSTIIVPFIDEFGVSRNYKAARFKGYYLPTHNWWSAPDGKQILTPITPNRFGTTEAFSAKVIDVSHENGLSNLNINLDFSEQMMPRGYSRLRVVTLPSHIVKISASGFTPSTSMALGENIMWQSQDYATITSDANGNALFYGKWITPLSFKVRIEKPNSNGSSTLLKEKIVTSPSASLNGVSYIIDLK